MYDDSRYNPWPIIHYVKSKELQSYWVNTSANIIIRDSLKKNRESDRGHSFDKKYEELIIKGAVKMDTGFYKQAETSSLWGLFVNAEYLTIDKNLGKGQCILGIPNVELLDEFKELTADSMKVDTNLLNDMFDAFCCEDSQSFIDNYQQILQSFSYYDLKDENSFHVLFMTIAMWLGEYYEIESNKETGNGRCDIILKSKSEKASYILELKYLKTRKRNYTKELDALASDAIQQIIDKKYDSGLKGRVIGS